MLMAQVGFHEEEMEESHGDNNQHTWSTSCVPGIVLGPVHI